jgi:hypothetical protein
MDHQHIEIEGISVPRDLEELITASKRGELSTCQQVQVGYALEMWHNMAVRCEAAIHRRAKSP